MLNIPVALVSSLGEAGLKINPTAREEETGDFGELALLGHEAEVHFHSLEPASDTANPNNVASELTARYGEGKVTREICPNCSKKIQCFSAGVFEGANGMLQVYLMTTCFATIVISTSLIRFWNGPDLLGLCMVVDLSVIRIFSSG